VRLDLFAGIWKDYQTQVVDASNSTPAQAERSRLDFFSGAWAMFGLIDAAMEKQDDGELLFQILDVLRSEMEVWDAYDRALRESLQ
jgi:hypothetical protein